MSYTAPATKPGDEIAKVANAIRAILKVRENYGISGYLAITAGRIWDEVQEKDVAATQSFSLGDNDIEDVLESVAALMKPQELKAQKLLLVDDFVHTTPLIFGSTKTFEFKSRDDAGVHKAAVDLLFSSCGLLPITALGWWLEPHPGAACQTYFLGLVDEPVDLEAIAAVKRLMPDSWTAEKQLVPDSWRGEYWINIPCILFTSPTARFAIAERAGQFCVNDVALVPISLEQLKRNLVDAFARWHMAGASPSLFMRLGRRKDRADGKEVVRWLVEGILPAGKVCLLAGQQGSGKSTLVSELAVAVAGDARGREWLGQPVVEENAGGIVAILSGEDDAGTFNARLGALDPNDEVKRIMFYGQDGRTLSELCEEIGKLSNLTLLIVDPARRYLVGDEDGSEGVSSFFGTLETLAKGTGATVVVVHHLTKNASPASLAGIREAIRGSAVWTDRPRVVIGLYQRQGVTTVGVIKHNIPPAFPMINTVACTRDAVTLRHLPISGAKKAQAGGADDEIEHKVLTSVDHLLAEGKAVKRRGKLELWAYRLDTLKDIGRDTIRTAVDKLVRDGLLRDAEDGLAIA
jgi:AAA domain